MASASTARTSLCKICYEKFSNEANKRVCTIPCGHISHESCLKRWFREQRANNLETRCPECRRCTRLDEIILLYGEVPTLSPANRSQADIRREVCERSRLLNPPPELRISIRTRLLNRLSLLCTHEADGNFRKVYLTLMTKLILTLGLLMLMTFHDESKKFICEHYIIIIFAICFVCGMICCIISLDEETISVVGGGSILYLSTFTICNLWSLGPCVTSMYSFKTLILAIGLTTFMGIILTMIAFKMRLDLTEKREVLSWNLLLLILIIIMCSIVWYFVDRNLVVWFFVQSLCLFVCCLYLMMFTQLMKENTYNRPVQYIFLAVGLYASIINMLIFILKILGEAKIF